MYSREPCRPENEAASIFTRLSHATLVRGRSDARATGFREHGALMRVLAIGVLLAIAPAPTLATTLYLDSYGWSNIYRYDTGSGTTTLITPTNISNTGFVANTDFGPDGLLYGADAYSIYRINLSGPEAVWSKYLTLSQQANDGLAFAPNGTMYLADNPGSAESIWAVDSSGNTIPGSTVTVTHNGGEVFLGGIDFAPNGTLYGSDFSHIYTINLSNGAATVVNTVVGSSNGGLYDLDYGSDGILRALSSDGYIYAYNPSTGLGGWQTGQLLYNGSSFSPIGLASPNAAPEPSTGAIVLAFALVSAVVYLQRRRSRRSGSPA